MCCDLEKKKKKEHQAHHLLSYDKQAIVDNGVLMKRRAARPGAFTVRGSCCNWAQLSYACEGTLL